MAISIFDIIIILLFIGYLYFTFKKLYGNWKKEKVLPVYIITEPIYKTNKEIPIFVKSFTYTVQYPIEVI